MRGKNSTSVISELQVAKNLFINTDHIRALDKVLLIINTIVEHPANKKLDDLLPNEYVGLLKLMLNELYKDFESQLENPLQINETYQKLVNIFTAREQLCEKFPDDFTDNDSRQYHNELVRVVELNIEQSDMAGLSKYDQKDFIRRHLRNKQLIKLSNDNKKSKTSFIGVLSNVGLTQHQQEVLSQYLEGRIVRKRTRSANIKSQTKKDGFVTIRRKSLEFLRTRRNADNRVKKRNRTVENQEISRLKEATVEDLNSWPQHFENLSNLFSRAKLKYANIKSKLSKAQELVQIRKGELTRLQSQCKEPGELKSKVEELELRTGFIKDLNQQLQQEVNQLKQQVSDDKQRRLSKIFSPHGSSFDFDFQPSEIGVGDGDTTELECDDVSAVYHDIFNPADDMSRFIFPEGLPGAFQYFKVLFDDTNILIEQSMQELQKLKEEIEKINGDIQTIKNEISGYAKNPNYIGLLNKRELLQKELVNLNDINKKLKCQLKFRKRAKQLLDSYARTHRQYLQFWPESPPKGTANVTRSLPSKDEVQNPGSCAS